MFPKSTTFDVKRKFLTEENKKGYVARFIAPRSPRFRKGRMDKWKEPKKEEEKKPKKKQQKSQPFKPKPKKKVAFTYFDATQDKNFHGSLEKPQQSCSYVMLELAEGSSCISAYPVELCRFVPDSELRNRAQPGVDEESINIDELEKQSGQRDKRFKEKMKKTKLTGLKKLLDLSAEGEGENGEKKKSKGSSSKRRGEAAVDDFLSITRVDEMSGDKEGELEEAADFREIIDDDEELEQNDFAEPLGSDSEDDIDDGMNVDENYEPIKHAESERVMRNLLRGKPTKQKVSESEESDGDFNLSENDLSDMSDSDSETEGGGGRRKPKAGGKNGKRPRATTTTVPGGGAPGGSGAPGASKSSQPPKKKRKTVDPKQVIALFKRHGKMTTAEFLNNFGLKITSPELRARVIRMLRELAQLRLDPVTGKKLMSLKPGVEDKYK